MLARCDMAQMEAVDELSTNKHYEKSRDRLRPLKGVYPKTGD